MRPIWTGALTFGLVNIPVRLMSAVRGGERISFRHLHAEGPRAAAALGVRSA
jgi:non-homologous end joining protein Ku